MCQLILASTSPARRKILHKFGVPFQAVSPVCDETPLANEGPEQLVMRLAQTKAASIQSTYAQHYLIGSDQVGLLDGEIIGKPHTVEKACQQLRRSSGKTMTFYTGLCVIDSKQQRSLLDYETYTVTFRELSDAEIEAYIAKEQPLQCAGSFKCDELGITLFAKMQGNDLNALVGLPLIRLNQMLIELGFNPLLQ